MVFDAMTAAEAGSRIVAKPAAPAAHAAAAVLTTIEATVTYDASNSITCRIFLPPTPER